MSRRKAADIGDQPLKKIETDKHRELKRSPETHKYLEVPESRRREAQFREKFKTHDREIKASGKKGSDAPVSTEQARIQKASEGIKGNERMKHDKWKTLSVDDKRRALDGCGKEIGKAYDHPEPPLMTEHLKDTNEQGYYRDGNSYDSKKDKYNGRTDINPRDFESHGNVGSDYGIRMNKDAITERNKKLFGDDPREAVETYGHEFRHSYQHEQAKRYEKGFKVDDPAKAKEWSDNFKDGNYKQAPSKELAETDRARYDREFAAYENQPVERDSREFGDKLAKSIFEQYKIKE